MSQRQRKQNYIDGHVQGSLLKRIFLHWISFFVVCSLAIILLQTLAGDPHRGVMDRMGEQFGDFTFFAVIMAALLPAFMLDTIRFSNRFVGPIARFRRHLRELGAGDTNQIEFRGNDFWQDMAGEFNRVTDRLKSQEERITQLEQELASQSNSDVAAE